MPGPARVELHLRDIAKFFHSLDPSPFPDRDLDREVARFIREEVQDRRDEPVELVVHLPKHQLDGAPAVAEAVHRYFARERDSATRELHELMRFARFALVAGVIAVFVIVAAARALGSVARAGTIAEAVAEALTIVAWVFLWRPAELLLFDRWPVREKIRLFHKLAAIPVRCVAHNDT